MQEMYARMTANNALEMIVQMPMIQIGDIDYYGCKRVFLKEETVKGDDGKDKTVSVVDETKTPEYDNITQLFNDNQNTANTNAALMGQLSKLQLSVQQANTANAALMIKLANK